MSFRSKRFVCLLWRCLGVALALGVSPASKSLAFQSPTAVQLSPSTAPGTAEPAVTTIYLTGTGYPAGTINPAQVTVQLQPQAPATGPAMTAVVSAVTSVLGGARRIAFAAVPVNPANNVPVPTNYLVSVAGSTAGGATFASSNSATLTLNPPASITSVSPAVGTPGQSFQVSITGLFSSFTQGSSVATFGPGISVGGASEGALGPITVISNTSATAQITLDPAASLGARTVSVSTGIEVAVATNGFQVVSPTLSLISPNTGQQGQQNLSVAITGQYTHFVQGTTKASFGAGITVASLTVNSATSATALINIASSASIGATNVTLTTGAEVAALANGFTVKQATVAVPNVVGDTQAVATSALTAAQLKVGTVTTAASSTIASGSVISESPSAGASVNVGLAVNLVISSGPAKVAVPNVVGDTQAAATTAITGGRSCRRAQSPRNQAAPSEGRRNQ